MFYFVYTQHNLHNRLSAIFVITLFLSAAPYTTILPSSFLRLYGISRKNFLHQSNGPCLHNHLNMDKCLLRKYCYQIHNSTRAYSAQETTILLMFDKGMLILVLKVKQTRFVQLWNHTLHMCCRTSRRTH